MPQRSALPSNWDVPQEFRDRLGREAGRQRAMLCDGHLLLVLHAPPEPEQIEREARLFWRKPDESWSSNELGSGSKALDNHLDQYAAAVERCDELEEQADEADERFDVLNALTPIHRAARHMHQTLQEARKLVPADRDLLIFRDRAYQIERTAELLYGQARNALDFAMAQRAEEQAQSGQRMAVAAHRLNLLAAFFFPIAALTALFGVNMKHGWENAAAPMPFLAVLGAGLILGGMLTLFVTQPTPRRPSGSRTSDRGRKTSPDSNRPFGGR